MARRQKILVGMGGCVLLCVVGAFIVFLLLRQIPTIAEQLPLSHSSVAVQLSNPAPRTEWALNSFVLISARAQSTEPITKVELYINGKLYDTKTATTGSTEYGPFWMWQPGVPGEFILAARAIAKSGAAAMSEPVRITATEAAFTVSPITAKSGDTLSNLAKANGVALEQLQAANPDIDPQGPIQPGLQVKIPNPPAAISNANIIPGLPITKLPDPQTGTDNNPPPLSPHTTVWNDLQFLIQANNTASGPKLPPPAPELKGDFSGCDVRLRINGWFYDSKDPLVVNQNEDGFYVYRSRDGSTSERIASIPPIKTSVDDKNRDVVDKNQYGNLVYYVSAWNILGETPSQPVSLPLDVANCQPPSSGQAGTDAVQMDKDGKLLLPLNMDTAYLYIQINGSKAVRVPEGQRNFLPGSGIDFNIYTYLDSLLGEIQEPDLDIRMEVWGWSGGALKYVGEFHVPIHRTILTICSLPGQGACDAGGGQWVGMLNLPQDQPVNQLKYDVRWKTTTLTSAEGLYFQLAAAPFYGDAYNATSYLLYARTLPGKGTQGTWTLDLGNILYPPTPHPASELLWGHPGIPSHSFDYTSNGFLGSPPGQPFALYMRLKPTLTMQGLNRTSNIVPLLYSSPPPPSQMPPLASTFSTLYDVEILRDSYKPPQFYDPAQWGCVIIDEDPTGTYTPDPNTPVCPGKKPPQDDCAGQIEALCLLKGMANAAGFVYDQFALAYEVYKSEIKDGLVSIIPGCDDDQRCKDAIHEGVDAGASALTGLPPDMPASEDLIGSNGAAFIIEFATGAELSYTGGEQSAIELFCTATDCEEAMGNYIASELKHARSLAAQPACINGYEAWFHGQQPACLDPSIVVHAAPNSGNYAAVITVRVTRKNTPQALAADFADRDKYQLFVTATAERADPSTGTTDTGPLYQQAQLKIPWLEPGQSIVLAAPLGLLGQNAYDTKVLYWGGTTHMKAFEACYSSNSSWDWVPCQNGGQDTWDFANPSAP